MVGSSTPGEICPYVRPRRRCPATQNEAEDETFSIEESLTVLRALRDGLGLGPERFPLPAFVGMISDEIEQWRRAGRTDRDIAGLIANTIGRRVAPDDLARYYAAPESRRGHGG